jgi:hypothetical protein
MQEATKLQNTNAVIWPKAFVIMSFFVMLGFCRGWTEFFRLLGYYAEWGGLKQTFRDYLSVLPSRVKLLLWQFDLWRWYLYVAPKRRFQTTSRCLITQKTENFCMSLLPTFGLGMVVVLVRLCSFWIILFGSEIEMSEKKNVRTFILLSIDYFVKSEIL